MTNSEAIERRIKASLFTSSDTMNWDVYCMMKRRGGEALDAFERGDISGGCMAATELDCIYRMVVSLHGSDHWLAHGATETLLELGLRALEAQDNQ